MTTFRTGEAPPAWCELTGFEIVSLRRDDPVTREPTTKRERQRA